MAKVVTVRPDWTSSTDEITDDPKRFLADVYGLIGNGCDFVEAVNCGDGLYMLVDEEPFRRDPEPPANVMLHSVLTAMGYGLGQSIQGAAVFVGQTPDGGDLASLPDKHLTSLVAACGAVQRIRH